MLIPADRKAFAKNIFNARSLLIAIFQVGKNMFYMKNFVSKLSIFLVSLFMFQSSFVHAETRYEPAELTPNDHLIYAVKGTKAAQVLLASLFFMPLSGLLLAAYQPDESNQDLKNIDNALAQGANINYQEGYSGYTALIYAAYYGYPQIAAHLIFKGADVNMKENEGYNAYTMALYYVQKYTDYLKYLDSHESSHISREDKASFRKYRLDDIARYQQVVELLEPVTFDHRMP